MECMQLKVGFELISSEGKKCDQWKWVVRRIVNVARLRGESPSSLMDPRAAMIFVTYTKIRYRSLAAPRV